ncbi:MAG: LabA-like NYN domain-containing protein [Candidatus Eiseniibacteriota bacterium]
MAVPLSNARVGIYVDGQTVSLSGGHGMRYDVLREFATRDGAEAVRMNVYLPWDDERAADAGYRRGQENFAATLRDFGYKVIRRSLHTVSDEAGGRIVRAGTSVALTVDALDQTEHLERVLLLTGDGDLADLVRAVQGRGCRVEVVAFDGAAKVLREEADLFVSGFLIPNLLPIPQQEREAWGKNGGKARGVCYNHSGKGYGFLRYLRESGPGIWITDSRHPDSPYATVFFHDSQLPKNVAFHQLPSRDHIFEFDLRESERFEDDLQAVNLKLVSGPERVRPSGEGREEPRSGEAREDRRAGQPPVNGSDEEEDLEEVDDEEEFEDEFDDEELGEEEEEVGDRS